MGSKVYRSKNNKILAGVCGGIGEYFKVDPLIVRIVWIAATTAAVGIPLYILAIFLIPQKPANEFYESSDPFTEEVDDKKNRFTLGAALVLIGVFFLLKEVFQWFSIKLFLPFILIAIGASIIYKHRRGV